MPGGKKRQKSFVAATAVVVLVVSISGTWLALGSSKASTGTIPASIIRSADFPLYYPQELPRGFTVNPETFSATKEVVTYSLTFQQDKKLIVSQQPMPAAFDFKMFYQKSMSNSLSVTTSIGEAKIGPMNGVKTVSLLTDKTWVLITAPSGADDEILQSIIHSFKLISNN